MPNKELIEEVGRYIEKHYIPDRDDIIMDKEMTSIFDRISSLRKKRAEQREYEYDECDEDEEIIEEVIYVDEDGNPVEDIPDDAEIVEEEELVEEDFVIDNCAAAEFDESDIQKVKFTSPMSLAMPTNRKIEDLMGQLEETFSQRLLRMISERGMTDAEAYNKAYVDRRHFSKIRKDVNYVPNKKTVLAFAIALELSMDETKDLLNCAGFALSRSSKTDIIVAYFLQNQIYDMFEINDVLYAYGQPIFE